MQIKVNQELIEELRTNFSAEMCVKALMSCATNLAASIGVKVTWSMEPVTDTTVNRRNFQAEFGKMAAIAGAMAAGARFNPVQYTKERDDEAQKHREATQYFSPRKKDDKAGKGRKGS